MSVRLLPLLLFVPLSDNFAVKVAVILIRNSLVTSAMKKKEL